MISVFIDTSSISEAFFLDQDQINDLMDYTVKEITGRFAQEWENEASRELGSSRQQYINSIVVVDEGFAKGSVMLVGSAPNMIESGSDSFDMKDGLLNGPNSKVTKDGKRYNTVPFRVGTPTAQAENFNGGIMPQEVYDIVSEKEPNEPLQKGDLKDLPKQLKEPKKKSIKMPESKVFKEYQHKHSIYEGITKKQDSVTKQNTYVSFRRVSENSDPLSWIYPGIEPKQIADKVLQEFDIPSETGRAIDKFLKQM